MQKVERHIKRTITKLAKRLNPDEDYASEPLWAAGSDGDE